jgi:hypothetical protein
MQEYIVTVALILPVALLAALGAWKPNPARCSHRTVRAASTAQQPRLNLQHVDVIAAHPLGGIRRN